jgi:predicted outer membrane protein
MRTKLLMSAAAIAVLMAGGVASAQNPNVGGAAEPRPVVVLRDLPLA